MVRTEAFRSFSKLIEVSLPFSWCCHNLSPQFTGIPEPKGILHDPQAHFPAERHQRFRVKLNAADRQGLVLYSHRDAILGTRRHGEHIGHAVALDIERMVAADHDFIRQVLHQPPAPHLNLRWPAMRRVMKLAKLATEILADRLHPETDPEYRQSL